MVSLRVLTMMRYCCGGSSVFQHAPRSCHSYFSEDSLYLVRSQMERAQRYRR